MRRRVAAAGGYYSRQSRMWVFPPAVVGDGAEYHATLEDAAEAADDYAARARNQRDFARREADWQRANRYGGAL